MPCVGFQLTIPVFEQAKTCLASERAAGRAVAQAVSRWLPTATARVRVRAGCGVCRGQIGTGAGFLRVLRFPLPIIPPISPSLSPEVGTIGLLVAVVPSRPNWTPPRTIPIKKKTAQPLRLAFHLLKLLM
jgi:hypothetical protein